MYQHVRRMAQREPGASAVESALLVVAVALILVFGAFLLGRAIRDDGARPTDPCPAASSVAAPTTCPAPVTPKD